MRQHPRRSACRAAQPLSRGYLPPTTCTRALEPGVSTGSTCLTVDPQRWPPATPTEAIQAEEFWMLWRPAVGPVRGSGNLPTTGQIKTKRRVTRTYSGSPEPLWSHCARESRQAPSVAHDRRCFPLRARETLITSESILGEHATAGNFVF